MEFATLFITLVSSACVEGSITQDYCIWSSIFLAVDPIWLREPPSLYKLRIVLLSFAIILAKVLRDQTISEN